MRASEHLDTQFPKISIVMLNFNGLDYLKRTIGPILALDYPDYEFIIVDNGSQDQSLDFIKEHPQITLIQSPRIGEKNFACNLGVRSASGEFLLILDNDLLLTNKELLKELYLKYTSLRNPGELGLCIIDEGKKKTEYYGMYFGFSFVKNLKPIPADQARRFDGKKIGFATGACFFIKKSIWLEVGGYDEHFPFGGDDNDLGMKLWMSGYENYLFSESCQIHIGKAERSDVLKYSNKFRKTVHATLCTIVKNFSINNLFKYLFTYSFFIFLKALKQSFFRVSIRPLIGAFRGYIDFLKDLPYATKARKIIQEKRVMKKDVFLLVQPV